MACVQWSSESRTTRAPPPSRTNCHEEMTFGSALEFSHFPLKKRRFEKVTMGEAGQPLRQAQLGRMADAGRDPRSTANARTANAGRNQRFAFVACTPGAGRAMAKPPMIAEWNARLPPAARQGRSGPLTVVYAGVAGQGPSVSQGSNAPWHNPARPSDNLVQAPISHGIRPETNCIESADAASTT
jgi:hypothetical protein